MKPAPPEPAAAGRPARPWAVLCNRSFGLFWAAQFLSMVGDWFGLVALPWLVLQETGSGTAVGAVLAAQAVPRTVLLLVGGALTDRLSPRTSMLASAAARAVLFGLLGVLVLAGATELWHVYAIALGVGATSAFFLPSRRAALPRIVDDEHLEAANALMTLNLQLSVAVGPLLAGLLVAAAGTGYAFLADAAGFACAAALVALLPGGGVTSGGRHLLGQIRAGLAYAWADVGIRITIVMIAVIDFCAVAAMQVGLTVLAGERFPAEGAVALGALRTAWGLGSVAGVIGAGLARAPRRIGWLFVAITAWIGAGVGVTGLAPTLTLALAAGVAGGVATGVVNTFGTAWLQRRTDPAMQGRVSSLFQLASLGLQPVSLSVAGLLAQDHVELLFAAASGVVLAMAAGAALSRSVRALT